METDLQFAIFTICPSNFISQQESILVRMRTARLLSVSRSIPCISGEQEDMSNPPPPPMQTPL